MREGDNSSLRAWAIILLVVTVLAVVYPLSFGPMFWLCSDPMGQWGTISKANRSSWSMVPSFQ